MQIPEVLSKYKDLVEQYKNELLRSSSNGKCGGCTRRAVLTKYVNKARERDRDRGINP